MIDLPKQLRETCPEDLPVSAARLMDMAADEIDRLKERLTGIYEWSVNHEDAKQRAQNALLGR